MNKDKRQDIILNLVNSKRKVYSNELAMELNVSEDTIRRDLNSLSAEGLINKVHGGAISKTQKYYSYNHNLIINNDQKESIAKKAVTLIDDGASMIISDGTTNLTMARFLPNDIRATIYTYCLPIAMELANRPNIELFFLGGKINKNSLVTISLDVIQKISRLKVDYAFLGTGSITPEGITEGSYEVASIKREFVTASDQTISLVTSDKLDRKQSHIVCDIDEISTLITDLDPADKRLDAYRATGVKLL